jgi:hypothetical protein
MFFGSRYHLANELRDATHQPFRNATPAEKRSKISICVIDDNPFEPKRNLENAGYRITFLGDVNSIDPVTSHHIVLCDLMGVGTALDQKKQGAFLIKEIKRNLPEKYVVAYTGGGFNQIVSRDAAINADFLLKKDADIEEWVDTLDMFISKLVNPYEVWQRQRLALAQREVDSKTILELESAFVTSIIQRERPGSSKFKRFVESGDLSKDARSVLQGMIASGLYALLFG